jgi:Putative DNA-binding domain
VIGDRAARKRMNSPTLRARIADLEDSLTERKQGVQSHDEIRKAVVSFANSVPEGHTAVLFIGVANDGTVTGVATDKTDKIQQQVRRVCEEDCFPAIAIHLVNVITIDGKHVIAFEFGPSQSRPHFAGHAYIRVGSESVKASASKLDELIASRNTKAGRLLAAKDKYEHVTLVIPVGATIPGQYPFSSRREWECTVAHCDAHSARFYQIAAQRYWDLPLEFLLFSRDPNWGKPGAGNPVPLYCTALRCTALSEGSR